MTTREIGPRWWPAALILVLAMGWLGWVWLAPADKIRQERVMETLAAAILTTLGLLVWLLALSRLRWRTRLLGVLSLALLVAAAASLFRIRGVSGDLVPILEPRWQRAAAPPASEVTPQPIAANPVPSTPAMPAAAATLPDSTPADDEPAAIEASPASAGAALSTALSPPAVEDTPPVEAAGPVPDQSYPQFLGPRRDGTIRGVPLARDWSAQPPRLVWRQPIGPGWSGFAIAEGQAITQEQRGDEELVVSYELTTGEVRWIHADPARYESVIAGNGPRATPTVTSGAVFTLGSTGILNALDMSSGALLWTRDVVRDNDAKVPEWGKSCSPLIVGEQVVVSAGGPEGHSLVAYDRQSGEPLWAGGDDQSGYASPLLTRLAGSELLLIFNRASVAGHDPGSGELLWQHPWSREQPNVSQPLPLPGDRVLVSSGYGIGSKLLQVTANDSGQLSSSMVWETPRLKAKFTNLVHRDGYVYGLDDGILTCLDMASGKRQWKRGRYGHGQVLLVGDLLLVQTEGGEIALVVANPEEHVELTRHRVLEGKTWNPPALAGSRLLVRNDLEAALYELPLLDGS